MPEIIDLLSSPELPASKPSNWPKPVSPERLCDDYPDDPFRSDDADHDDAWKTARDVGILDNPVESEPAVKKRRLSETWSASTTQNVRQKPSTSFGATGRSPSPQAPKTGVSEPIDLDSSSPIRNVKEQKQPTGKAGDFSFEGDLDINPFESSSPKQPPRVPSPQALVHWDPISSSVPQQSTRKRAISVPSPGLARSRSDVVILDDSHGDEDENGQSVDASSSDSEFPEIDQLAPKPARQAPSRAKKASKTKAKKDGSTKPAKTKCTKSAAEKALEKEQKAAAREAEKQRKQQEKDHVRAEKAQEKERAAARAQVNKLKTNKKAAVPEMIVRLPDTLGTTRLVLMKKLLGDILVQCDDWHSPVADVVTWRRKVDSVYNERLNLYEPVSPRVDDETYAVVILTAADLVKLALAGAGRGANLGDDDDDEDEDDDDEDDATGPADLDSHVAQMKQSFPGHTIIYMIEGLTAWLRKNKNLRNRQFTSAVRTGLGEAAAVEAPASSQGGRRRKKKKNKKKAVAAAKYVSEDVVEDALMDLQMHDVLVHRAEDRLEAAQWVVAFTEQISTTPYRRRRQEAAAPAGGGGNFCMDTGQVRTGDGPRDTYVRMLQEVVRVTVPVAYAVVAQYPTVPALVRAFDVEGPLILQGLRKSSNKDGAFTDRAVGPAISRRLHKIFTCQDETSTDV